MIMREKMARAIEDCWRKQFGPNLRANWYPALAFDIADAALDCLTTPPSEAMVRAACEEARKEQCRPVSINRVDAAMVYEAMIRAMIQEGKADADKQA